MPVLDSALLIDLEAGHAGAVAALHKLVGQRAQLLVPAPAAIEYVGGLDEPDQALQQLADSYDLVPLGRDHVLTAARIGRRARDVGQFPGWSDASIGAVAVLGATYVLTADAAGFRAMGCDVWDYRNEADPPS